MIPDCKKRRIENGHLCFAGMDFFGDKDACAFARTYMRRFLEEEVLISTEKTICISLLRDELLAKGGYSLRLIDVFEIRYNDYEGVRNALATLIQLMECKGGEYIVPRQDIEDYPDCLHRSVMIDLARGLPDKERLKEDLKRLSLAKCNRVHFHLMDEEGICYRSEIFPFEGEINGTARYSKQDLKDLVVYCRELGMEIIPEIEFPAHANALTAVYPTLKCQTNLEDQSGWTVCMGSEETYEFFEKLIKEICEMFPYEYMHIGGDEHAFNDVPALRRKYYWCECEICKARMKKEKLADERDLFYYGVKRLHETVRKAGRKMILWNDALDVSKPVDIPKDITVQFWRIANAHRGPRENCSYQKLLRQGFDVICSPFEYCYIDLEEYANPEKTASFDYKAYEDSEEYANNVIGCEACAWEYGNPVYSHYTHSFTPSAIVLLAKMWNRKDTVFNKAYRKALTKLIFGMHTPKEYDVFEIFGSVMPPRTNDIQSYVAIENELIDEKTLKKHREYLNGMSFTYSEVYKNKTLSLVNRMLKNEKV